MLAMPFFFPRSKSEVKSSARVGGGQSDQSWQKNQKGGWGGGRKRNRKGM